MTEHVTLRIDDAYPGRSEPEMLQFLHAHGRGLASLAQAIDDAWLEADVAQALELGRLGLPSELGLRDPLRKNHAFLEVVSQGQLQRASRTYPGTDIAAAVRWYGARLEDLLQQA